jgi:hypothetical protein
MNLAYDLTPENEAVRLSLSRAPHVGRQSPLGQADLRRSRHRIIPDYKITWAEVLFELGFSCNRVARVLRIGHCTALDIQIGRRASSGMLALELEPGERYVDPHCCERGHWIRVVPCRACRAIAAKLEGQR